MYGETVQEISPIWGLLFSVIATVLLFVRTTAMKVWYRWYKVDPMNLTVMSYLVHGVILTIVVFSQEIATIDVIRDGILGGGLGFLGNVFVNHATTKGYAGPAAALSNMQVVIQVLIDAIFLDQVPNTMQIIACVFGVFGSVIITLGPALWDALSKKNKNLVEARHHLIVI